MLRFLVFDASGAEPDRVLKHAHLIGPDSAPVAGEIGFAGGLVDCSKSNPDSVGLALQVGLDASGLLPVLGDSYDDPDGDGSPNQPPGVLTLQTCLLPERERPYLLSLELARHRIMLFYHKLEQWQLVDLPADHVAMERFEQARGLFMQALAKQHAVEAASDPTSHATGDTTGDPTIDVPIANGNIHGHGLSAEADKLALRSLFLAVEAGERLALEQARRDFVPRASGAIYERALESAREAGHGPSRAGTPVEIEDTGMQAISGPPLVGCAVSPGSFTEVAREVAAQSLDFVRMPMRWVEMEPTEGRYQFKGTDQWIEWAVRKAKLPVVAGPLIDFRPSCVPQWLYIWENDYETLRDYVCEHIKNLVTRYRRTVSRWTVLTGVHVNDNFHFSFDQMMDLTRIAVTLVRKLDPTSKIFVEIAQPWGEYYTSNRRSLPPLCCTPIRSRSRRG